MSKTVKLEFPVIVDGETITSLTMRRPRVADSLAMAQVKGGDGEKEVQLFTSLCEVAPKVIQELDLKDYAALQKGYEGFLS